MTASDDLADRLDEWANWSRTNNYETPRSSDLRAAAAELRRLRQQVASLTDAIGEHRESALRNGSMFVADREYDLWDALDVVTAAVEALNTEDTDD